MLSSFFFRHFLSLASLGGDNWRQKKSWATIGNQGEGFGSKRMCRFSFFRLMIGERRIPEPCRHCLRGWWMKWQMCGAWCGPCSNCFRQLRHVLRRFPIHVGRDGHGWRIGLRSFPGRLKKFSKISKQLCKFPYLFSQLTFVLCESWVGLVKWFLQQHHILLIFLALDDNFLDGAFLLSQDLDGFRVVLLLGLQFKFQVTNTRFQFGDGTTSSNDSVGFNFFKADWKILWGELKLGDILQEILQIHTLTSTSKDFLMASILTMRVCSSLRSSMVDLSSTWREFWFINNILSKFSNFNNFSPDFF